MPATITILAGQSTSAPFRITGVNDSIVDGTQTVTVTAIAAGHADGTDTVDVIDVDVPIQTEFEARTVQAGTRIEAEAFDNGGAGLAYFDTSAGNDGNTVFRTDTDVDIYPTTDGTSGWAVGRPNSVGEWLEYTTDVVAGTYDIDFRLAASGNDTTRTVRILVANDVNSTNFTTLGTVSVPLTGSQENWQTVTLSGVDLSPWAGTDRVIRLELTGFNFQINWVEFDTAVVPSSTVVSRGVAYRGAGTSYGTDAIDTTKSALHGPGAIASMNNFTNYLHGINRVVIDIDEMSANDLTAADFQFRVGNTNNFANAQEWTAADAPAINVQALSATTRRVTLDWPDGTITNQWLEVTVRANANTNLAQDDVFYFGNQIGDVNGSVSSSGRVTVNSFDSLDIRRNQSAGQNSVGIGNLFDVDRNGSVNSFDTLAVRRNQVAGGGLLMITLPGAIANLSAATSASPPAAASLSASPLQNQSNPLDVNGDGAVTALDALIGINFMGRSNAESESFGFAGSSTSSMFYDVNGDGIVTARDSLQVINGLAQTRVAPLVSPPAGTSSDRDDDLEWVSNDTVRLDLASDLAILDWAR